MKRKLLYTLCISVASLATSYAQTWNLVWADEFNQQIGPDWSFETGGGNNLWGNNELENYQLNNTAIENGSLVIIGKKETVGGFNYTSARMITSGHKSWKYGKMEASIRLPYIKGTWPAFWMMGDNGDWPACGEIDIMEQVNTSNVIEGTAHWYDANEAASQGAGYEETSSGGVKTISGLNATQYHTYTVEWDKDYVKWFVDGVQYFQTTVNGAQQTEMRQPFYILLNLAIGGDMTGNVTPDATKFPAKMYVDYVRVYQLGTTTDINDEMNKKDGLAIYPNPASNTLSIIGNSIEDVLEVYNTMGQEVKEGQGTSIDVAGLEQGVYFLTITTQDNQKYMKRFVKE